MSEIDPCQHRGCPRKRTEFGVLCEEHHRQQLEKADATAFPMRWRDIMKLWLGPLWINVLRAAIAAASAGLIANLLHLSIGLLIVAWLTSVFVQRWSFHLVGQPQLRLYVARHPSLIDMIPILAIALTIELLLRQRSCW